MEACGKLFRFFHYSADELLSEVSTKRGQRVPAVGAKFTAHEHAEEGHVSADLSSFYADRRCLLSEEKIEKSSRLSEGVWRSDSGLVAVTKSLGRAFQRFGHVRDGVEVLYPEEALFLMEARHLTVSHDGLPLSVQEAYTTFLKNESEINTYHVYSHLRRLGFVVMRHCCRNRVAGSASHIVACCNDSSIDVNGDSDGSSSTVSKHELGLGTGKTSATISASACNRLADSAANAADGRSSIAPMRLQALGIFELECPSQPEQLELTQCAELMSLSPLADSCKPYVEALCPSAPATGTSELGSECVRPVTRTSMNQLPAQTSCCNLVASLHVATARQQVGALVEPVESSERSPAAKRQRTCTLLESGASYQLVAARSILPGAQVLPLPVYNACREMTAAASCAEDDDLSPGQERSPVISVAARLTVPYYCCTDFIAYAAGSESRLSPVCGMPWDWSSIAFPGSPAEQDLRAADRRSEVEIDMLSRPPAKLSSATAEMLSAFFPSVEDVIHVSHESPEDNETVEEFVFMDLPLWWPYRHHAKTWTELKTSVSVQTSDGLNSARPLAFSTYSGVHNDKLAAEIEPLAGFGKAHSYKMLLNKLDIIKHWSSTQCIPLDSERSLKIVFDVFKPDNNFRKSCPGPPHLQVCVASAGDTPPTMADLSSVCCSDRRGCATEICWALVDNGSVSCFTFTCPFTLPDPLGSL